jgi:glycine/D-amino acid oxidase-like deaminating enzyme
MRDMPRLRVNTPLWLGRDSVARRLRFPTLTRELKVDVAVVGGGITGAALAWRFADAGVRVALVEAARIGRGSTAASTALLMQEPDTDLAELSRRYGTARARRAWQLSLGATRDFVATLTRLSIECDLVRRDSIYYAMQQGDVGRLRDEHRRRTAAGIDARWLEGRRLRRALGFDAPAGIRTRGNAQADPFKACLGLMRAAERAGACVFERSPVTAIRPASRDVLVRTSRGSIRADRVVIATGYATPYFKPLLARFKMLNTYVVATRPLTQSERRRIGPGAVMLWDTGRPYHYARWTRDHRLILGGGDRPVVPERQRRQAFAEGTRGVQATFVRLYPGLEDIALDWQWEGLFATTRDGLPYIGPHRRYPRQLFALGYGGNGMTFGFLAARLLLEWYLGNRSPDHALFAFSR